MRKNIKKSVDRAIQNARNALTGTITSTIKDDKTVFVNVSDEEIRDIKVVSPYGFFSLPLNNQMGQILFNNTSKKASIVGVEHDKLPVEMEPGEAVVYCQGGTYMHFKNDGKVYIQGPVIVNGGTKDVARVDDTVEVNVPEHGICTGKITSGTPNIKA